jgi:hypothetical protein
VTIIEEKVELRIDSNQWNHLRKNELNQKDKKCFEFLSTVNECIEQCDVFENSYCDKVKVEYKLINCDNCIVVKIVPVFLDIVGRE